MQIKENTVILDNDKFISISRVVDLAKCQTLAWIINSYDTRSGSILKIIVKILI